jgi:signal recognition particle subunit SEC65
MYWLMELLSSICAGSRAEGRRVPSDLSLDEVTVQQIAEVATSLGYEASVESATLIGINDSTIIVLRDVSS